MTPHLRNASIALGIVATTVLVYDAFKVVRALRVSASPKMKITAYSASPAEVDARLLVIGDSTAVGTGSGDPALSVAGRIGTAVPHLRVDNSARDGALIDDLMSQLDMSGATPYDGILVQIGGNDILRWTPLQTLEHQLDATLARATRRARHVALIVPGLVGNAPAVPWPLSIAVNHRSRAVRQRAREIALRHGVDFVDISSAFAGSAPTGQDHERVYAADGLHLSAYGYGRWYQALREQSSLLSGLQNATRGAEVATG